MTALRADPVGVLPADTPRDVWLGARQAGIGASEIAAVMGISPWESPFSLYWRKVNGWRNEETEETTAGHRAEPVIADWWAEQHPDWLVATAGLYAHPDRPWQMATPDRLVYTPCDCPWHAPGDEVALTALLECKYLVQSWDGWGEPGTDDIPVYYRAQCLWQLDVLGVDQVHVAAWHGAQFREYLVRRDETDLTMMREAGRRFWQRVQAGDPPPVDEHSATLTALKRLHPSVEDIDVEVDARLAAGYARARRIKTAAEKLCDRYEAELRAQLGDARRAVHDGRTVATRVVTDIAERTQTVAAHTRDYLLAPRKKAS